MSNVVYLITGANRPDGIGFATAKYLLDNSSAAHVVAAARDPAAAVDLQQLSQSSGGRLVVIKMDVSDLGSVKTSFNEIAGLPFVKNHGIDVLFANAGLGTDPMLTASQMPPSDLKQCFDVNTWGAIYVIQTFLPLLRIGQQKKIVYTSSGLGSTELSISMGLLEGIFAAYSISKAATNHFLKRLSDELNAEGFTVVAYQPGLVATSMNKIAKAGDVISGYTAISAEEAGRLAADNILAYTASKDNGKFYDEKGNTIPW